jgi:hypothetical protein
MSFDFRDALAKRQATLLAALHEGAVHTHPGAHGDESELDWRGTLERFLPRRYAVSKAEVVDSDGARSDVFDVVIHDVQYTPILFQRGDGQDSTIIIPAESVYAVFEVKQQLHKGHFEYAAAKVASARRLHRTSRGIRHAGGTYDPKPLDPIIGGVLTDRCDWSPCFGDPFLAAMEATSDLDFLDLGCALDGGSFEAWPHDAGDGFRVETSPPDLALMFLLIRLLDRLQAIGTAPALDMRAYGRTVWDESSRLR